ncbi:DNA (cytosine-5-)-methyltransferase [Secundilactobacillus kimchicus]|uniref:DNA cytosine methyltransferase n=1 Tax=Secundilactobacillus kimchicus TaxID=528209 RepID=UPI001C034F1F|nr:DNA cytosine methyltransferase [Secundilactobacillus kimchicus]MBT9670463.1 DNA (cytosine-5-)-methyltransferase [Secundilactobacillus kimchicus]
MKFIDLFAGIGGFHLGMEQAGHECVGWVEWDKFARKSYQAVHNVKDVWTASDINEVKAKDLPQADVWCGGFPCQDISVAGYQKGFTNGKRSSLFFTITGLLRDTPKERRPKYLFLENVKNLLSINKGWDFLRLQAELDEIGYDAEWDVLDSSEVVPQHRERVFIIGHLRGGGTRQVFPIQRENGEANPANQNKVIRVGNVNPSGHGMNGEVIDSSGLAGTLTTNKGEGQKVVVKQLGNISDSHSFGGNPQVGRVYDTTGIAPTLSTLQGGGQEPKILDDQGRLNKELTPADIVPTLRAQSHGNLPKILQSGHGFNHGGVHDIAPTLTSNSYQDNNHVVVPKATYDDYRIRKLTPKECWRLQGFPDWAFEKAKAAGLSDSQLYKQAGNSVTVPVIRAIAERLGLEDIEQEA